MTTWDFRFFQIVSMIGALVAIVMLGAGAPNQALSIVVVVGVPLLCFLVAGVGHATTKRLETLEAAVRESRRP